jgi:GAF domain-containing protein
VAASYRVTAEYTEFTKTLTLAPGRSSVTGRVLLEGKSIQIPDVLADPEFFREAARLGDYQTILGVPLLRGKSPVGLLVLHRVAVRPFTEKQIKLVEIFADQAVIAIENTRLFEAEQERTRELSESLEQQTATSEVLQVISRSAFDLEAVLNTLVESAARLCEADKGVIQRPSREKASYHSAASYGHSPEYIEYMKTMTFEPGRGGVSGRVLSEGRSVQIADVFADPEWTYREAARLGGYRTILGVPLLREGVPIGLVIMQRAAVRPFTEKQIKLVETFADQAVIAIENTRLFESEQQRTRELTESLEQQTAISAILRVISNSPGDVQPVLDSVAEHAARICEAQIVDIILTKDDELRTAATFGQFERPPRVFPLDRSTVSGRSVCDRQSVHVADLQNAGDEFALGREFAIKHGHRSVLAVPLTREGRALGTIVVLRTEVRPFEQKHIALLTTFADQAAIAIENVRLFEAEQKRTRELAESLEQQTATSEVLQVISSSPGDLEPVFEAMLEKAVRICDANFANIFRWDGELLHLLAVHNTPPAFAEARRQSAIRPTSVVRHMVETKTAAHVFDLAADESLIENPATVEAVKLGGVRTFLSVPMLKENELIGSFSLYRQEVRPFTDKQIALVTNFAAQAVIAIENARLLNELRQRNRLAERTNLISRETIWFDGINLALVPPHSLHWR